MKQRIAFGVGGFILASVLVWAAPMPDYPLLDGDATSLDFIQIWDESSDKGAAKIEFPGVLGTFLNSLGQFSAETDPIYLSWDKDFDDLTNTPPEMSDAQVVAGTSTVPMLVSAAQLKLAVDTHAPDTFVLPTGVIGDFLQYDDTDSVAAYTPTTAQAGDGVDITGGVISVVIDSSAFANNLDVYDDTLDEVAAAFDTYSPDYTPPTLTSIDANSANYTFVYSGPVAADTTGELCSDWVLEWDVSGDVAPLAYVSNIDGTVVCSSATTITSADVVDVGATYVASTGSIESSVGVPLANVTSMAVTNNTASADPADTFAADNMAANYTQIGPDTTISVTGGELVPTANFDHVMYAFKTPADSNNMTVDVIGAVGEGRLQVGFRMAVTGNTAQGYFLDWNAAGATIYECTTAVEVSRSNCTQTALGYYAGSYTQAQDYTVRITVSGLTATVWVGAADGSGMTQIITGTLPHTQSGNTVAIGWYSGSDYADHSINQWSVTTP